MGYKSQAMKFALALIALTALTVSAHWTHDESLAREIGPPPGEEDVEVASLEGHEELLQTKTGTTKTYRITFGTVYTSGELRASMSNFKVALKGAKPAAPEAGKATQWNEDTTWQTNADNQIRYYQGSFMTYAKAKEGAPDLHPGMTPFIDQNTVGCSAKVKGKSQVCQLPRPSNFLLASLWPEIVARPSTRARSHGPWVPPHRWMTSHQRRRMRKSSASPRLRSVLFSVASSSWVMLARSSEFRSQRSPASALPTHATRRPLASRRLPVPAHGALLSSRSTRTTLRPVSVTVSTTSLHAPQRTSELVPMLSRPPLQPPPSRRKTKSFLLVPP